MIYIYIARINAWTLYILTHDIRLRKQPMRLFAIKDVFLGDGSPLESMDSLFFSFHFISVWENNYAVT